MKNVVKRLKLVMLISMITVPTFLMSQELPDPVPPCDVPCPIDSGVSLLIAAGLAFGFKKVYDQKKEEKDSVVIEG